MARKKLWSLRPLPEKFHRSWQIPAKAHVEPPFSFELQGIYRPDAAERTCFLRYALVRQSPPAC